MIAYCGCAFALKFSVWKVDHLSPTLTMDLSVPDEVLKIICSVSGSFLFSSTYNDTTTNCVCIRLSTVGSVQTLSSIFRQFTQAQPVKSINTGFFSFLAFANASS